MAKRPAYQWYPADFKADTALQSCNFVARSLWREMLDLMHDGEPYGHLTSGGEPMTERELSEIVRLPVRELKKALAELERKRVFSRTEDGVIYSRRMVRDEEVREKRASGGPKSLENPKVPRPKNQSGKGRTEGHPEGQEKGRGEGYPSDPSLEGSLGGSPSSSSSSSSSKSSSNSCLPRTGRAKTGSGGESVIPAVEDVAAYMRERDVVRDPEREASRLHSHYDAIGWVAGGSPIRDWKAIVRKWETTYEDREERNTVDLRGPVRKPKPLTMEMVEASRL